MNEYCEQLKQVRKDIPGYEKDVYNELDAIFSRYLKILVSIGGMPDYEKKTSALRGNSVDIKSLLEMLHEASKTKKQGLYQRIVDELMEDIRILLSVVECE